MPPEVSWNFLVALNALPSPRWLEVGHNIYTQDYNDGQVYGR